MRDVSGVMVLATSTSTREEWGVSTGRGQPALCVRELVGLSVDEVAVLLTRRAGLHGEVLAEAVRNETGGYPALVHAVAKAFRERDVAERLERALDRAGLATDEQRRSEELLVDGLAERLSPTGTTSLGAGARQGVCPYKGLAPFDAADAALFFGRERLVATLVARVAVSRFVAVVGASGSGKSSLLRAGLLPALAGGALPGSERWPFVVCTPGAEPFARLAEALAPVVSVPADELRARLARDPDEIVVLAHLAVRGREGARAVVVVDQFEELVTQCGDAGTRASFVALLAQAVTAPDSPLALVICARADYYGAFGEDPTLGRLIGSSQVLVGAMTETELQRAVVEPARRAGLTLEDGLAELVCADATAGPGALPLVSTAMLETWARRDGDVLTVAGYEGAGGVRGALARSAEEAYTGLD
ncbi:MAG TPA: NACHT domain-containing protein, partial [Acidimicrobiales bacterium]|nr:NACHT domain-containing protein [Acidimicrobiales bacterium]